MVGEEARKEISEEDEPSIDYLVDYEVSKTYKRLAEVPHLLGDVKYLTARCSKAW